MISSYVKAILGKLEEKEVVILKKRVTLGILFLCFGAGNPEARLKSKDLDAIALVKRCKWFDPFKKLEVVGELS
jgi:hypothetical protein